MARRGWCIGTLVAALVVTAPAVPAMGSTTNSDPSEFVRAGDRVFFVATDALHGEELWVTDLDTTRRVRDIRPGTRGSQPDGLVAVGDEVFFLADDGVHGRELWRSDGTKAGTSLAVDANPGPARGGWGPIARLPGTSSVVFQGEDGAAGREPWISDGTPGGSSLLVNLMPGATGSFPDSFAPFGTRLLFRAQGPNGSEPYVTDGTNAGTLMVADVNDVGANSSSPGDFVDIGGGLALFAATGAFGRELYRTDGTPAGTQLVVDIRPAGSSEPAQLRRFGAGAVFTANDGVTGQELWFSDGTNAGTDPVANIRPGAAGSSPNQLLVVGGQLYFAANDGTHGAELWRTDGTPGGTTLVRDVAPGAASSTPRTMGAVGGRVVFMAFTPDHGAELWRTDGTAGGTALLHEPVPGPLSSTHEHATDAAVVDGRMVFSTWSMGAGHEPHVTDGTTAGTGLLRDVVPGTGPGGSLRSPLLDGGLAIAHDGRAFFTAMHPTLGQELWVSAGTPASTRVIDVAPGGASSAPRWIVPFRDGVAFGAHTPTHGHELWYSDGTPGGTRRLTDAGPGVRDGYPEDPTPLGSRLVFTADEPGHGRELWLTDGTPGGTTRISEIQAAGADGNPQSLTAVGDRVFFSADNGVDGREPWSTDGSPAGTVQVTDLRPGGQGSFPTSFVDFEGDAVFSANDGVSGPELWRSDGSAPGTQQVADLVPGGNGSSPYGLVVAGNRIFFVASTPVTGHELAVSDGVPAGTTVIVEDIEPGNDGSGIQELTPLGSRVVFSAARTVDGREPWVSNGTPAGTSRLKDIDPSTATAPSQFGGFTTADGRVWFTAVTPASRDAELWRTDGTAAGTVRAGLPGVSPRWIEDGSLWYTAHDPDTGEGHLYHAADPLSGTAVAVTVPPPPGQAPSTVVERLEGPDRYATAAAVSAARFDSAQTVVIARGDLYADALAGGPLARSLQAPILLVEPGALPATTAAEIDRLGATDAIVLGGPVAVSEAVVDAMVDQTSVTVVDRVSGADRFATAAAVADRLPTVGRAFLVEGANADPRRGWPDAVAVSALASVTTTPILLTTRDQLPAATVEALETLGDPGVTIVGGEVAVSAAVGAAVEATGATLRPRLAGDTRYTTSLAVAAASEFAGLDGARTWVATGATFPDALVAGPAAALSGSVLLLAPGDVLPLDSPTADWFRDRAPMERVTLLGGPVAISEVVEDVIRALASG